MKVCAVDDAYSAYQETEKRSLADYYITDFTEIEEVKAIMRENED